MSTCMLCKTRAAQPTMKSLTAAELSAPHAAAVREDLHIPCRAEKHMEEDRQRSSPVPQKGNFNTHPMLRSTLG